MPAISRCLTVAAVLIAFCARAGAEERWKLKFEHEPPRKIMYPRHMPADRDLYFGQKPYWYVVYRVTNESRQTIKNMCLRIWIETDAERRLARPYVDDKLSGLEGLEFQIERERYPIYGELGNRASWGQGSSKPLEPFVGVGACYADTFLPMVHDAIAATHGNKPKFDASDRFNSGPLGSLPTMFDCFDVNTEFPPGETRTGVAIFVKYPVRDSRMFNDALNFLSARAEKRKAEDNAEGFNRLRQYVELFPEGQFARQARELLELETDQSRLDSAVDTMQKLVKERLSEVNDSTAFAEEIKILVDAAKWMIAFKIKESLTLLEEFRSKFQNSHFYPDADLLYTLGMSNLIERAREEAKEMLRRHESESISDDADRLYIHVTGLMDPIYREGNSVFSEEPELLILYRRVGDSTYRDFQNLRKVEERMVPGPRRFLRKMGRYGRIDRF